MIKRTRTIEGVGVRGMDTRCLSIVIVQGLQEAEKWPRPRVQVFFRMPGPPNNLKSGQDRSSLSILVVDDFSPVANALVSILLGLRRVRCRGFQCCRGA
jgi:hypothetical protein